ncbi:MAG: hypothetical protein K6U74_10270 [Firmicutes bacterium]|nr:hypothetical protein [Bacillota bacterium]
MKIKFLQAVLVLRTALRAGTGYAGELTDSPVRRDAAGDIVIPGASAAGVLRDICTRLAPRLTFAGASAGQETICRALRPGRELEENTPCNCPACKLFGDVNPGDESDEGMMRTGASKVWVYDLYTVDHTASPPTSFRDFVGINRRAGTADRQAAAKYDSEMVPAGSRFLLKIKLEKTDAFDEELLSACLGEWQAGRGCLGGGKARGFGAFDLQDIKVVEWDLNDPACLMDYLSSDDPWAGGKVIPGWQAEMLARSRLRVAAPPEGDLDFARCFVSFEATLQGEGPLLASDAMAQAKFGFDHAPLFSSLYTAGGPVLPGSGLRGVLRSQAEKILRTMATCTAGSEEDSEEIFCRICPACDPLARDAGGPLASCDALLQENRIGTGQEPEEGQLCLACLLFGSPRQGSRLVVEDAHFIPDGGPPALKAIDFLAIDRFTGGGLEGAKFDALALWRPKFRLRLRLENPEEWELGLLTLVLRDLEEGFLRVGFGAAKGFGEVTAGDWRIQAGFLHEKDLPVKNPALFVKDAKVYSGIYRCLEMTGRSLLTIQPFAGMAGEWLTALGKKVGEFRRNEKVVLRRDSYFGQVLEKLYRLEV